MTIGKISKWQPTHGGNAILLVLGVLLAVVALAMVVIPALSPSEEAAPGVALTEPGESTTDSAIEFWEARVRSTPGDVSAHNKLALAYIQRARESGDVTDYAMAQAQVDASLESERDNYEALALQASLHVTRNEYALALETANAAIAQDSVDPFARAVAGDALLGLGDYDAALETYRELVEASPSLTSYSRLARIHELRGDAPAAEAAWQNAFEVDDGQRPENTAWARVEYGHYLFTHGDIAGADAQYQSALETFPGYIHALAGRARVAAANGQYDEAIALYEQLTERQPVFEYVVALGDVYLAAGRKADAESEFELAGTLDSLYRESGINTDGQMALFLTDHDLRLEEAVDQAAGAYEAHPNSIYTADALSWALHKAGRNEEALTYSERAVRLGTQDANILFHASMINFHADNHETAHGYLKQVMDTNPKFSLIYAGQAAATLEELNKLVSN